MAPTRMVQHDDCCDALVLCLQNQFNQVLQADVNMHKWYLVCIIHPVNSVVCG